MNPSFKEKAEEITGFGTYGEYLPNVLVERVAEALRQERENTLRLPEVKALVEVLSMMEVVPEINMANYNDDDVSDLNNRATEVCLAARKALSNFNNLLGGKS